MFLNIPTARQKYPCPGEACDWENRAPLLTVAGTPIVIDNTLELGHTISGVIKDEGDSPTGDGYVIIWDSTGYRMFNIDNDGSGNYESPILGDGTYYAAAWGEDWGRVTQLWENESCPSALCDITAVGTPIDISGSNITGIDFNIVAQMPASISGHILDSGGNPNPGGAVQILDAGGNGYGDFWVDENGYFETYPLADGTYFARTRHTWQTIDEVWDGIDGSHCPNLECDILASTPIVITGGINITDIDFWLDQITSGGTISGTITDGVIPLSGVNVQIFNANYEYLSDYFTDESGLYQTELMADGNFFVRTWREPLGMAREFWDDIPCQPNCENRDWVLANADLVPLNGGDASGINFVLAEPPGYAISGRVTDQAAGHGMSGVYIILFDANGTWFADTVTNMDGDYSFAGLSADYQRRLHPLCRGCTGRIYPGVV